MAVQIEKNIIHENDSERIIYMKMFKNEIFVSKMNMSKMK